MEDGGEECVTVNFGSQGSTMIPPSAGSALLGPLWSRRGTRRPPKSPGLFAVRTAQRDGRAHRFRRQPGCFCGGHCPDPSFPSTQGRHRDPRSEQMLMTWCG